MLRIIEYFSSFIYVVSFIGLVLIWYFFKGNIWKNDHQSIIDETALVNLLNAVKMAKLAKMAKNV